MRGEILSFDAVTGMGHVAADDGQRYTFDRSGFSGLGAPRVGQRIDFVPSGDIATNIMAISAETAPAGAAAGAVGATGATYAAPAPTPGAGIDWQNLFLSFNGRIRRSHFWIGWVILFVGGFVIGLIPFIGAIIGLLLIWPNLAIQVKRLHDMDKSGWFVLAPFGLTIVLFIAMFATVGMSAMANQGADFENNPAAAMAVAGPALGFIALIALVNLGFLLWIGISEGTRGENKFGPDPKTGVSVDTFS